MCITEGTTGRRALIGALLVAAAIAVLGCADAHPGRLGTDRSVRYSACTGRPIGYGEAQLHALFQPSAGTDCSALAADCDSFLRCLHLDPERPCDWPGEPRCDGDVVEYCDPSTRLLMRRPCADGTMCVLGDSGVPDCRASGPRCDVSRCEGNELRFCADGVEAGIPCDGVCVESDGNAFCADAAEACDGDRCEGSVRVSCRGGVAITRSDCADRLGATTCRLEGAPAEAECVVPPSDVECEDRTTECVGSTGRVCVEGAWIEFRCGDFLDGRCVEEEDEGDGFRCVVEG